MDKDIFGRAFHDYMAGKTDGVILVETSLTEIEDLPVSYFFRSYKEMPEWEQLVIDRCRGRVLDVGAGAGSHALELQDRGMQVCAVDVSPGAVETMRRRGVADARCVDFFDLKEGGFDTILFLMNGAGMAATLEGLDLLLRNAADLLNANGKIYLESTDLIYMFEEEDGSFLVPMQDKYYGELEYRLVYDGIQGKPFPWLFVDADNLMDIAEKCGFLTEIIFSSDNLNYIACLTRKTDLPKNERL